MSKTFQQFVVDLMSETGEPWVIQLCESAYIEEYPENRDVVTISKYITGMGIAMQNYDQNVADSNSKEWPNRYQQLIEWNDKACIAIKDSISSIQGI